MPEYYGVDVSSNNGIIDWTKAKGIDFVIIRVTQLYGIDESFEHNLTEAKKAGFKVGGYKYSYAKDAKESKKEAEDVISALNGRPLDFPIYLDLEWGNQIIYGKDRISEIIEAFREVVEREGYLFGIYCNVYWYENYIPDSAKEKYEFWISRVPNEVNDDGTEHESLRPSYGVGWQYSWEGRVDGLGDLAFDKNVFYKDYSEQKPVSKPEDESGITAKDVLDLARKWLGRNESDGTHRMIIDVYNSKKPLARGYEVQYSDQWCDTFVSALFIKLNAVKLIGGTECGVEEHVKLFQKAGIWEENGSVTPNPGDLIVFNWDQAKQPNDGFSDHIGIVEDIKGKTITTIEGNYKDSVKRRELTVGDGRIRGYAKPKYASASSKKTEPSTDKKETGPNRTPKWVGRVTASFLNVRSWAGIEFPNIKSWPMLERGNLVDVCDTIKDSNGKDWYYVRINGTVYGFCCSDYIGNA